MTSIDLLMRNRDIQSLRSHIVEQHIKRKRIGYSCEHNFKDEGKRN